MGYSRGGSLLPFIYADVRATLMTSSYSEGRTSSRTSTQPHELPSCSTCNQQESGGLISRRRSAPPATKTPTGPGCLTASQKADATVTEWPVDQWIIFHRESDLMGSENTDGALHAPQQCSPGVAACCLPCRLTCALMMTSSHSEDTETKLHHGAARNHILHPRCERDGHGVERRGSSVASIRRRSGVPRADQTEAGAYG